MSEKSFVFRKRELVYVGIIILLVAAFGLVLFSGHPDAAFVAKDLYDIRTGGSEIIKVEEISGLYKVSMSFTDDAGRKSLQDVYVTKDGKYILATGSLLPAGDFKETLTKEKTFAQCLVGNNVVIFGSAGDQNSVLQLQSLGIGNFASKVFFDCSQNPQACQQLGIDNIPTMRINGTDHEGLQSAEFVSQQTGCGL